MSQRDLDVLANAVERMHGGKATFIGTFEVDERHQGAIVWKGTVSLFQLTGHPTATRCYAWSVPADGAHGERFYAVLHTDKVDSPAMAVRASILADAKAGRA